jgi:fructose-1-phosphate kinase PfkB-like protein
MATQADYKAALQDIITHDPKYLDDVNTILAYVNATASTNVVISQGTDNSLAVTGS